MWKSILDKLMTQLFVSGEMTVTFPDGEIKTYGDGRGLIGALQIHDKATMLAICRNVELGFGEGFMDGSVTVDGSSLEQVMRLAVRNLHLGAFPTWLKAVDAIRFRLRRFAMHNTVQTARSNVAHHYDLSEDLYRLFLDADMQYSCAYFRDPGMSLEAAQIAKKAHIARKLRIEPGMRVLDIGCGWGGMALTLAGDYGAQVIGVTLSENQLATAQARASAAGLNRQTEFRLMDYRDLSQPFDRVVSVGMLEHVGAPHYDAFFGKVADLMPSDGVALIHTIGRNGPPVAQSPWLNKYIFPGGYVPSIQELIVPIAKAGLWNLDIESWRMHYAYTLRHWLNRFNAQLGTVQQMYDDRFVRMWQFYLVACIMVFEERDQTVFQFQLGHQRDTVPLTRDYLYAAN